MLKRLVAFTVAAAVVVAGLLVAGPVLASAGAAAWALKSVAQPTKFSLSDSQHCNASEGCDAYLVTVTNVSSGAASVPVVIKDRLPRGVDAVNLEPQSVEPDLQRQNFEEECSVTTSFVTCKYEEEGQVAAGTVIGFKLEVLVTAEAEPMIVNRVEVEGGGVAPASLVMSNPVSETPAAFGLQQFTGGAFSGEGASDEQAGAHPDSSSVGLDWTTFLAPNVSRENVDLPVNEPKTQIVDLPAGFVADAQALGQCPLSLVEGTRTPAGVHHCPAGSQAGWITLEVPQRGAELVPLFNVAPEVGYPAELAFEYEGNIVTLLPRLLPSSEGYVLSVSLPYIPRVHIFKITGATANLFGDPTQRDGAGNGESFFTNPDACSSKPLRARVELNSWVQPEHWVSAESTMFEASKTQAVSGCSSLIFQPTVQVAPETTETDTPSGYEVDIKVPQGANSPGTLATPDLKDAVVTLPEGVSPDPSAANGLQACQAAGSEGIELGAQDRLANENEVEEGEERGPDGLVHPAAGHCPSASTIGEVEVVTPLLAEPLHGHVFLVAPQCGSAGQPQCTPHSAEDGELFGIYMEVAGSGTIVKLRGEVSVNPQTGRVTTRFTEIPQFPVSEVKLKLNGGARASLANPQSCATATTMADLTPWSTPYTPDATPQSSFPVTGCTGGAFSPAFTAGTTVTAAGAFSPYTVTFSRKDGEQDLSGVTVNQPSGLLGRIAGVVKCGEAEIKAAENNTGACPEASKIGTATAGVGAGGSPFYQSGSVYLTGPYNGAPFGLAVVVAANAGPFHLGNIVVRAAIHIDQSTANVSVLSSPLPQVIDGVPLRVQTVNVTVGQERSFTFNPTSCSQKSVNATITSTQGTAAAVSSPFAAAGCAALKFAPKFSASTAAKASKAGGASLDVKVGYPSAPFGRLREHQVREGGSPQAAPEPPHDPSEGLYSRRV